MCGLFWQLTLNTAAAHYITTILAATDENFKHLWIMASGRTISPPSLPRLTAGDLLPARHFSFQPAPWIMEAWTAARWVTGASACGGNKTRDSAGCLSDITLAAAHWLLRLFCAVSH